jgi:spermidine dehydrogenase
VPAFDVRSFGYPGFAGLGLPADGHPEWREPYIYHFPDGNASLARLLARKLVPGLASGATMDDIVLAAFDYDRLDRDGSDVRIRLNSTVIDVRATQDAVDLGYVRAGRAHRVTAKHTVLGCFHMMIPYLMPDLPAAQRQALTQNVKTPLVYVNVLTRNWKPWLALKVSAISAPMAFFSQTALDFPVSLGGYRHSQNPDQPIVVHMAHVPGAPNSGLDARAQFHIGQGKLLAMTFANFEDRIRDQLDRMLGAGGFDSRRDIGAITVNRWPHGYGYVENSLFDGEDYEDRVLKVARQRFGRVAIANSDAAGDAFAHLAIDQAARAVRELLT